LPAKRRERTPKKPFHPGRKSCRATVILHKIVRPDAMSLPALPLHPALISLAAGRTRGHPANPLVFILFLAACVGFGVLALVSIRRQQRKARAQLAGLAARFGLELRRQPAKLGFESPPSVEGRHRNRAVRFFNYSTGAGKSRTNWSAVAAAVGGTGGFTLELFPENFLVRLATALGLQDIRVGDPAFDRAFVVKSNDPAYAVAALLPEIRARLIAERGNGALGHLTVKEGEVRYAEVGAFDQEARVARLADMLGIACDLAEVAEVYQKT
jgi:hypothetical protein